MTTTKKWQWSHYRHEAVQLLLERARRIHAVVGEANSWAVCCRICQLVEGLPLGIEMAAAAFGGCTPVRKRPRNSTIIYRFSHLVPHKADAAKKPTGHVCAFLHLLFRKNGRVFRAVSSLSGWLRPFGGAAGGSGLLIICTQALVDNTVRPTLSGGMTCTGYANMLRNSWGARGTSRWR